MSLEEISVGVLHFVQLQNADGYYITAATAVLNGTYNANPAVHAGGW